MASSIDEPSPRAVEAFALAGLRLFFYSFGAQK